MKILFISKWIIYLSIIISAFSCSNEAAQVAVDKSKLLPSTLSNLTEVIIRDIYTPPVASRIYAYTYLAYYEGVKFEKAGTTSITEGLKGFDKIPTPLENKTYDFTLAGITAFYEVARSLVFSKDSLTSGEDMVVHQFRSSLPADQFENSVQFGKQVAAVILKRSKSDNYDQSRGMPRFSVYKTDGKWRQTSPDYADAVEPYWSTIHPLLMDSAAQFKPAPPPAYSMDKQSQYYKEMLEVYEVSKKMTASQDTIATYWDDNAFVTKHEGHLMYANKKTTPVGHWMGITSILCTQQKVDPITSARIYAITASAIFDGFISCWEEKFRSSTVRPITVIQEQLEEDWESFLQTPPFPEYTSGHSVISSAAATVLTRYLGENIAFTDTTEMEYLGLKRSFPSIEAAAEEVGISRLYGGIHFRTAITQGSRQGKEIGALYNASFGRD